MSIINQAAIKNIIKQLKNPKNIGQYILKKEGYHINLTILTHNGEFSFSLRHGTPDYVREELSEYDNDGLLRLLEKYEKHLVVF